jgi:hypothetical protein
LEKKKMSATMNEDVIVPSETGGIKVDAAVVAKPYREEIKLKVQHLKELGIGEWIDSCKRAEILAIHWKVFPFSIVSSHIFVCFLCHVIPFGCLFRGSVVGWITGKF